MPEILLAEYAEFSQSWYRAIGATVCITLILLVLTTPASNLGFQCMYACKKCCDRGCTCDRRKTKQLVQEDYENINTGNEFMFEFRYSSLLTVLAVAFLYSGGMPVMYPTAATFFYITYWIDKCLILRYYRRPI